MYFNMAGILILLLVCGIVTSNPDRSVDCRKFVFAPLCRGVAAKRATLYELMNFENNESYKPPVKPFQSSIRSLEAEDNESLKPHFNLFQPAMRPLSLEDYESFRKFMKPLEFAMKSIALQDNESYKEFEKPLESSNKSTAPQDNERACETF